MRKKYRIVKDLDFTMGSDDTDFMFYVFFVQKRRFFRYKTIKKFYSEYFARKYISEQEADYIINDRP